MVKIISWLFRCEILESFVVSNQFLFQIRCQVLQLFKILKHVLDTNIIFYMYVICQYHSSIDIVHVEKRIGLLIFLHGTFWLNGVDSFFILPIRIFYFILSNIREINFLRVPCIFTSISKFISNSCFSDKLNFLQNCCELPCDFILPPAACPLETKLYLIALWVEQLLNLGS